MEHFYNGYLHQTFGGNIKFKKWFIPFFPSNHEELETRIFVYFVHAAQNGVKRALIKTINTDRVAIDLAHFLNLETDELRIEFGPGKEKTGLAIHVYVRRLGKQNFTA